MVKEKTAIRAFVRKGSDISMLKGLDVEIFYGDILEPTTLRQALKGCSVVYHTAAVYSTKREDQERIYPTAIQGTKNLLEAALQQEGAVTKIVYTSSAAAIGKSDYPGQILDESHFLQHPVNLYSRAKLESELWARDFSQRHQLPVVFVLPSMTIGPHYSRPTPSMDFLIRMLKGFPWYYFELGNNIVGVEDVARGHLLAAQKGRIGERYILCGENVSNYKLMEMIAAITGHRLPLVKIPKGLFLCFVWLVEKVFFLIKRNPPVTVKKVQTMVNRYAYYSSAKAQHELGYTFTPLVQVLEETVEWLKTRKKLGTAPYFLDKRSMLKRK